MSDLLDDIAVGALSDLFDQTVADVTVAGVDADLDQFMMLQGNVDLADDIVADAMLADDHNDLAVVRLLA